MLDIKCLLSEACKSEDLLRENIKKALEVEGLKAYLKIIRVSGNMAKKLGIKGSPTVLINGEEIQPQNIEGVS